MIVQNTEIWVNWEETVNAVRNSRGIDPPADEARWPDDMSETSKAARKGEARGHIEFRGRGGCKIAHFRNTSQRRP